LVFRRWNVKQHRYSQIIYGLERCGVELSVSISYKMTELSGMSAYTVDKLPEIFDGITDYLDGEMEILEEEYVEEEVDHEAV
jgi:hypothetical protein